MGFVTYQNGNYTVSINTKTGEKVRDNHRDDMFFEAEFPECVDVHITDFCDIGCPFCYMDSTDVGQHAEFDYILSIARSFRPYTEVALGGGSPVLHPNLREILEFLRAKKVISNMTIHQRHFKRYGESGLIDNIMLGEDPLIKGLGVSHTAFDTQLVNLIKSKSYRNRIVLHAIVGVMSSEDIRQYVDSGINILLLGYKCLGRASSNIIELKRKTSLIRGYIKSIVSERNNTAATISFDNKAIEQLNLKPLFSESEWNSKFMGDDGLNGELTSASMFLNLVDKTFARNSMGTTRHPVGDCRDVVEMFQRLKREE